MPSTKPEAFGRSVAEASAVGLPVIAFDHGGATETILAPPQCDESKKTGIKVPVGDVEALAAAIGEITSLSPTKRNAMGVRGRAHIQQNFTKEHMIEKTLTVYRNLMAS